MHGLGDPGIGLFVAKVTVGKGVDLCIVCGIEQLPVHAHTHHLIIKFSDFGALLQYCIFRLIALVVFNRAAQEVMPGIKSAMIHITLTSTPQYF